MVPPGLSRRRSPVSAACGSGRCSSTKQRKTWSNSSARQVVEVARAASRLGRRCGRGDPGLGLRERVLGDVDGDEIDARAAGHQLHRLRADPAARLEHAAAGRVAGAVVQKIGQGLRLVRQPAGLRRRVAVHVVGSHTSTVPPQWSGAQVQSEPKWQVQWIGRRYAADRSRGPGRCRLPAAESGGRTRGRPRGLAHRAPPHGHLRRPAPPRQPPPRDPRPRRRTPHLPRRGHRGLPTPDRRRPRRRPRPSRHHRRRRSRQHAPHRPSAARWRRGRRRLPLRPPGHGETRPDWATPPGVLTEGRGLRARRDGKGAVIEQPGLDIFDSLRAAPARIDLTPGVPDLAAFPRRAWLRAERTVLNDLASSAFGYGDPAGTPALRRAVANWLARNRGDRGGPGRADHRRRRLPGARPGRPGARATRHHRDRRGGPRLARRAAAPAELGLDTTPIPVDGDGLRVDALRATGAGRVMADARAPVPDRRRTRRRAAARADAVGGRGRADHRGRLRRRAPVRPPAGPRAARDARRAGLLRRQRVQAARAGAAGRAGCCRRRSTGTR